MTVVAGLHDDLAAAALLAGADHDDATRVAPSIGRPGKLNDLDMGEENALYDLRPGQVHNLMADARIVGGDFFSGAHSQIAGSAVAHSVWSGIIAAS